uniref:Bm8781, isoform a n=1 Tax=Brugia malayi TaxID=6279 RepID=A0A1I9G097_BRUMA|nr:Bm8781, isoform a [Brugia malayi]
MILFNITTSAEALCTLETNEITFIYCANTKVLKLSIQQIAAEFEQTWEIKLQLESSVNRAADEPLSSKEGSERGGHGTEHPCWLFQSADCRMFGVCVAYACSGNLMRHLRSRCIPESVITQKE